MKKYHWNPTCALWTRYLEAEPAIPQMDRWLTGEFKRNTKFGKQDRAWYSEALFAAMRFGWLAGYLHLKRKERGRLDENAIRSDLVKAGASPRTAAAFFRKIPANELFFYALKRAGLGSPPEGELQQWESTYQVAAQELTRGPLWARALWAGVSPWLGSALEARARRSGWGDGELSRFLALQSSRPPLWIRLNTAERERVQHRKAVVAELESLGFTVETAEEIPDALKIVGEKPIFEVEGFKKGLFEIQDLASQSIGVDVGARPGQFVWDTCAGSGGKTMQLASKLANKGAVYATDIREHALDDARRRVRRAGIQNVRFMPWSGGALPAFGPEIQSRKGFDWVLVDAPCSASGTWRRSPDAKYRFGLPVAGEDQGTHLSLSSTDELIVRSDSREIILGRGDRTARDFALTQLGLLRSAAPAVKPGGHLVYGTCSFLVDENESVVEAFLAAEQEFELVREGLHGAPQADADTTYSAVMRRRLTSA